MRYYTHIPQSDVVSYYTVQLLQLNMHVPNQYDLSLSPDTDISELRAMPKRPRLGEFECAGPM